MVAIASCLKLHAQQVYRAEAQRVHDQKRIAQDWSSSWRACLALALWSLAGCAWGPILSAIAAPAHASSWMTVRATAYCPCSICTDGAGKTATGRDARRPGVAVDRSIIPLGSHLDIPGYPRGNGAWILADDVGGRVRGESIDLRMETHAEAEAWGVKTIRVRIWKR